MPTKRRTRRIPSLLLERHLFWTGDDTAAVTLFEGLALHCGVTPPFGLFLENGPTAKPWASRLLDLVVALAAERYPAFEKPPSKGGRPRRRTKFLFTDPWPHAEAARLAQLFNFVKKELTRRGGAPRVVDICRELVRRYAGRHPEWAYNSMKSAGTLQRAWERIPPEIKNQPGRFLPADGSEPFSLGRKDYLPAEFNPASFCRLFCSAERVSFPSNARHRADFEGDDIEPSIHRHHVAPLARTHAAQASERVSARGTRGLAKPRDARQAGCNRRRPFLQKGWSVSDL
jgi:hypothetical protein